MFRCELCGRSLVGVRADHPLHCRIETAIRAPRVELPRVMLEAVACDRVLVTAPGYAEAVVEAGRIRRNGMNPKIRIHEGERFDPFAPSEGPVQRGVRVKVA